MFRGKEEWLTHGQAEGVETVSYSFLETTKEAAPLENNKSTERVLDLAKAFERVSLPVGWAWATHFNVPRNIRSSILPHNPPSTFGDSKPLSLRPTGEEHREGLGKSSRNAGCKKCGSCTGQLERAKDVYMNKNSQDVVM